jgi:hypothetical protein
MVANGMATEEILRNFQDLERDDIKDRENGKKDAYVDLDSI